MFCGADINKNGDARRKFTQQLQENEMVLQVTAEQEDALQRCRMLRVTAPYTLVCADTGVQSATPMQVCRQLYT